MFHQRWYLLGMSDRLRTYALDRVQSAVPIKDTFVLPDDFDAQLYFSNCFGIIHYGQPEKVLLKVFKEENKDKYLKSLPLHCSQMVEMETDDFTLFSYYIQPTYDFRQELLSLGCEVEVLSPKWFRDEFSEIVEAQALLYENSPQ
jgi:predicted DNA-binding transcriptional regulator YafY